MNLEGRGDIEQVLLKRTKNHNVVGRSSCSALIKLALLCSALISAMNAISSRGDLNPASGVYPFEDLGHARLGGTDAKASETDQCQLF